MLYLEDFLEIIENVPQEIKDRTTDLRELDLGVQNTSDQLEEQIKTFFDNAKKMKSPERDTVYEKIRKEYYKLLDDADEKVNIATNMHDTLERYLRKLDQELEKFKCELEADSPGITEVLEKRSLELDEPSSRDKEKDSRYYSVSSRSNSHSASDWKQMTNSPLSLPIIKEELDTSLSMGITSSPPPSSLSYNLGHMGAGSNAIAAAASQAIAATQQMQQGRRTASLKASYDAITQGVHSHEFSIGSELASAAQTALAASSLTQETNSNSSSGTGSTSGTTSSNKRQKKKLRGSSSSAAQPVAIENSPAPSEDMLQDPLSDPNGENTDWTYDPNEPRYCICNQVSYGNMVACDNPKCPVEWFHYACVSITTVPKGKWYCPQCSASMNRRQRK